MIIDFHTHIFPDKIAEGAVRSLEAAAGNCPFTNGTHSALLSSMASAGVDVSVNLPVLTKPDQFDGILRFAKNANSIFDKTNASSPRIISFAGIHPDDELYEEHLYAIKDAGIIGIKIHPDYQGTFFDDEKYSRILGCAKELDLITVTHAGLDDAYEGKEIRCTPTRVLRLLDKLGGYSKLVLAHLGGHRLYEDVLSSLSGEDVYFDTALILDRIDPSVFVRTLERHGEDRLLFATDSPWSDQARNIEIIKRYSIGTAAENKIFSENARALLNI